MTLHREPVEATPRKSMTPARRRRVLDKHGHQCARLGCEIAVALEIDHVIPLELGGKDDDTNLEPLCGPHHAAKTRLDIKMIARACRIRKREAGIKNPTTLRGRPFGDHHRSLSHPTLKRGFDGKVRPRATTETL